MKALIIYDSFYGNTEQIAQAIGKAIGSPWEVQVMRVSNVQPQQWTGLNLLVVGSPTRGFRPTPAINKLLGGIPANGLQGVKVAGFDTRISWDDIKPALLRSMAKIFGFAAKPISDKLMRKGGVLAAPPAGFFVKGSEGPLREGELERAAAWAKQIVATQ